MRLDTLLRARSFMKIERPPEIWECDSEDVRFLPLLGKTIAAGLSQGAKLDELTLNVSNVIVDATEDLEPSDALGPPAGQYVAVTVKGYGQGC